MWSDFSDMVGDEHAEVRILQSIRKRGILALRLERKGQYRGREDHPASAGRGHSGEEVLPVRLRGLLQHGVEPRKAEAVAERVEQRASKHEPDHLLRHAVVTRTAGEPEEHEHRRRNPEVDEVGERVELSPQLRACLEEARDPAVHAVAHAGDNTRSAQIASLKRPSLDSDMDVMPAHAASDVTRLGTMALSGIWSALASRTRRLRPLSLNFPISG